MERFCKNCDTKLDASWRYCPSCGQEHKDRVMHFKQFLLDFLGDYFTFDSLIVRSVRPLLFDPGYLTNEFIAGRRVRYIPPLRLFIFISIIFFLLLGSVNQTTTIGSTEEEEFLDAFFNVWFPRIFFLLLPLFAFFLYLLFRKGNGNYLKHFIFSVHFHAFVFLLFTIMVVLIDYIFPSSVFLSQWSLTITALLLEVYLIVALRKVFRKRWISIIFRLLVLNVLYIIAVGIIFSVLSAALFYL